MLKRKRQNNKVVWLAGTSLGILMLGTTLQRTSFGNRFWEQVTSWSMFNPSPQTQLKLAPPLAASSMIPELVQRLPQDRAAQLQAIAQDTQSSDRPRARLLLASDLLAQQQPDAALALLEGLERDYSLLASYILYRRAQAYEMKGDRTQAQSTWEELLNRHSREPIVVEALYALGQQDPQYWNRAVEEFPAYPRTVDIALAQLKQNPNQLPLLLLVARHGLHKSEYPEILSRLILQYRDQLAPEDWEAIAFGYWERQAYAEAGEAYLKAPSTARNAYRAARGLQLGDKNEAARNAYRRFVSEFPDASETPQGLIHLATLSESQYAIGYLDTVIKKFPNKAAEALLEKARVLEGLANYQSAHQARTSILSQYSNSETAAQMRWGVARKRAESNDIAGAWEWARQVTTENPDSDLAPEAAFWVGKWAQKLGRQADADAAFEYVLSRYPETYYAWRSAVFLGWNVGDFNSVRKINPNIDRLPLRPALPVGSETLRELYLIGQDAEAWALWQVEFENPMQPSVAEQFTDGLMRLGVGDHIDALFMVDSLKWRDDPEEKSQVEILRQQPAFWHALYPFPYLEPILNWSGERQLNPLLVVALIRQESRFMPQIKSVVGATGLMQIMPETGEWVAERINLKNYQLEKPEDNIKMGTWYLDFTHSEYNNNSLLAVASYNAGPGNVSRWVERMSLRDPDEFVEKIPFPETKGYVKSVFGNYWNYLRLYDPQIGEKLAQVSGGRSPKAVGMSGSHPSKN